MSWKLNDEQKKTVLFHVQNAEEWLNAIKKECSKEPSATGYIKEKVGQVRNPLYIIERICNIEENKEDNDDDQ